MPQGGQYRGAPQAVFLRPLVQSPYTEVGEYTYYADPEDPIGFERHNVLYHYGPERLVIGRYCAIARDTRFVMGAANHRVGLSAFPFPMFGGDWLVEMPLYGERRLSGDTVVGHDVWFGHGVVVLPGVRIGDGAIVAAQSVVTADVPAYAVAAGNPARVVRRRFDDADTERLQRIAWWDWPVQLVTEHLRTIMNGTVDELERVAGRLRTAVPVAVGSGRPEQGSTP